MVPCSRNCEFVGKTNGFDLQMHERDNVLNYINDLIHHCPCGYKYLLIIHYIAYLFDIMMSSHLHKSQNIPSAAQNLMRQKGVSFIAPICDIILFVNKTEKKSESH